MKLHYKSNHMAVKKRKTNATSEGTRPCVATQYVPTFFSKLPGEVRDKIYKLVLGPAFDPSKCFTEPIDPNIRVSFGYNGRVESTHGTINTPEMYHPVLPSILNLLLVCKQIFIEAFHIFYATHLFSFADTDHLYRFLRRIGYARRQQITKIHFLWQGPHAKEAFRLLKTCKRLKEAHFTVPCSIPPGYAALREVRGLEKVKARAMIHFQRDHLNRPLGCFGDYYCHCACSSRHEPGSNLEELEAAMMRPRLPQFGPDPSETLDLFKPKREQFRKPADDVLIEEKDRFFQH